MIKVIVAVVALLLVLSGVATFLLTSDSSNPDTADTTPVPAVSTR